jgi:hypothetical protein
MRVANENTFLAYCPADDNSIEANFTGTCSSRSRRGVIDEPP